MCCALCLGGREHLWLFLDVELFSRGLGGGFDAESAARYFSRWLAVLPRSRVYGAGTSRPRAVVALPEVAYIGRFLEP